MRMKTKKSAEFLVDVVVWGKFDWSFESILEERKANQFIMQHLGYNVLTLLNDNIQRLSNQRRETILVNRY